MFWALVLLINLMLCFHFLQNVEYLRRIVFNCTDMGGFFCAQCALEDVRTRMCPMHGILFAQVHPQHPDRHQVCLAPIALHN